jgi:chemotaxis protein MotB
MALSRRSSNRFQNAIWPGFVDAMTGLLLVLMFVLTIFMVVQFVLRETIVGQESELDTLSAEVAALTATLGLARDENAALSGQNTALSDELAAANTSITQQAAQISSYLARIAGLETTQAQLLTEQESLAALVASLQAQNQETAAAAADLRDQLSSSDAAMAALTLDLERQRREAEETLTLLAAADKLTGEQADLLAIANATLAQQDAASAESQRQTALLNAQILELRAQVGNLQSLLDLARDADVAAQVQIETLGAQLNTALARVVAEERRRRALEEAERIRLTAEATRLQQEAADLARFKSDFFGQLREVLEGQDRIRIEGDRFIFASEVLFDAGSADLSDQGRAEIANIAGILRDIADDIPAGIDWVIRVDGHTDNVPLSGDGRFADNWELSQARALSVVRYMAGNLGIDPRRLAANGFGEYQPINPADTAQARAQNRRIELKLTER